MPPARRLTLAGATAASIVLIALTVTASTTPFMVYWTAPGDDSLIGRAAQYDLRWSLLPLSAAGFAQATRIPGLPAPAVSGTRESLLVTGLPDGVPVYLAIKSADAAGNWSLISNVLERPAQTLGVATPPPRAFLSPPWPNPARHVVRWSYALPRAEPVRVSVYEVTGRRVRVIADGPCPAGSGEWSWDLRDERGRVVGPGVYLVKARLGARESSHHLLVVR